ncbi:hypothetical protein BGZ63DRAFT_403516 [Mariannaea sp. PMI_226]|nr:hypothetical protein BGZ63DRAFT_403516 [Mariannaea sp. PMI_226]
MSPKQNPAGHDFGLRPSPPDFHYLNRAHEYVTAEPSNDNQQRSLSTENETSSLSSHSSSELTRIQNSLETPNSFGPSSSLISTSSSASTPVNPQGSQRSPEQMSGNSSPDETSGIGRYVGGAIQHSDLPYKHPLNSSSRDLWRRGADAVRRPDGTVHEEDVINWMLTRPGGLLGPALPWHQLDEACGALEEMRKETLDLDRLIHEHEKKQEELKRKKAHQQARKGLFEYRVSRMKAFLANEAAAQTAATPAREPTTDIQNGRDVDRHEKKVKRAWAHQADEEADIPLENKRPRI